MITVDEGISSGCNNKENTAPDFKKETQFVVSAVMKLKAWPTCEVCVDDHTERYFEAKQFLQIFSLLTRLQGKAGDQLNIMFNSKELFSCEKKVNQIFTHSLFWMCVLLIAQCGAILIKHL